MSDVASEDAVNPTRGRENRAEGMKRERRRRKRGSIDRMEAMNLDIFAPDQLDLANYVYRWVNDEKNRIGLCTRADDYDFVNLNDIKDFTAATSAIETNSESDERVRMCVGTNKGGNPIYAYLLRKPRDFWEEDQEEAVKRREEMMAGRVYRGEAGFDLGDEAPGVSEDGKDTGTFYVPKNANVAVGGAARRKTGPILKTKG